MKKRSQSLTALCLGLSMILAFFVYSLPVMSQGSDILLLKNRQGRTIRKYLAGNEISCQDMGGRSYSGMIRQIDRDSLFILQYDIRRRYTYWATTVADTLSVWADGLAYRDIRFIDKEPASFEFIRDGTLFIIGGVGYATLHLVNAAIQQDKVSGKAMAIAGGVAAAGWVMRKLRKGKINVGRKYRWEYIDMN